MIGYIMSAFIAFADESIDSIAIFEEDYQPGVGLFVGKVSDVSGKAVIVHLNETSGYHVVQDMKIYRGDMIFTGRTAKVVILLNDGSQISQGAESKIQFNQLLYSPAKRTRNAFINLSSGKARFSVQKLNNFNNRRFRVKTATALIGVRGSDFVIQVKSDLTEVAAFENTELELVGLGMPDLSPVILHPFEKSNIFSGDSPTSPVPLSIEEMDGLKNEFLLDSRSITQAETQEKASDSQKKQTIRISQTDAKNVSVQQLTVDADALQPPLTEFSNDINRFENEVNDNTKNITEQKHEIATELPAFPVFP
jgi:hypothetical protein